MKKKLSDGKKNQESDKMESGRNFSLDKKIFFKVREKLLGFEQESLR